MFNIQIGSSFKVELVVVVEVEVKIELEEDTFLLDCFFFGIMFSTVLINR